MNKEDQYRTGIFYHDEQQKRLAETSRLSLDANVWTNSGVKSRRDFDSLTL